MNQKYLMGLSSDMRSLDDVIYFEATPENIAAFLIQNQHAQMSAIGTMDSLTFLTARRGFIDICPDQSFLRQKLLPIYSQVQMGELPALQLKAVPEEQALAEKCPTPDWNYLRWDGYSDRKYQAIIHGEALLDLCHRGEKVSLELQVRSYYNGSTLAVKLADWREGHPEPWNDLTVNLGYFVEKDCAFINVNNLGEDILPWIEKNGLATPTGRRESSGFVTYPEYRFNAAKLQELDDYGYQMYCERYDAIHEPQQKKQTAKRDERF